MRFVSTVRATAVFVMLSVNVAAAAVIYPNGGSENLQTYSFTATSTGDLIAYFAGSGAALENQLGLLVNGVSTGLTGLNNHNSAMGESFNFGHVVAGDVLTFVDLVTGYATWYSDPALNGGNGNHVYSTTIGADEAFAGSVAGTYVAFEDLVFPYSDFNYRDHALPYLRSPAPSPNPPHGR